MNNSVMGTLRTCLCSLMPLELVDGMMLGLNSAINGYQTRQYNLSILSSGKFVEFALRALDFLATGTYTPLSERLSDFNAQRLESFARDFGSEPCRTLIPKALFSMYCIRNKRGGIHVAVDKPSRIDAAKLIHDMKWVVYEFVSIMPNLNDEEVATALENFSSPLSQIVWDIDGTKRILSEKVSCSEGVLLLLCSCDSMSVDQLRAAIEYKNTARFKSIISVLHKRRLVNCNGNNICTISPLGVMEVEKIINKIRSLNEIKD